MDHTAFDGVDGLERFETLRLDIVMLDIGMPQLDGHEVARRIRATPAGEDALLVAVTGWGQDQARYGECGGAEEGDRDPKARREGLDASRDRRRHAPGWLRRDGTVLVRIACRPPHEITAVDLEYTLLTRVRI